MVKEKKSAELFIFFSWSLCIPGQKSQTWLFGVAASYVLGTEKECTRVCEKE